MVVPRPQLDPDQAGARCSSPPGLDGSRGRLQCAATAATVICSARPSTRGVANSGRPAVRPTEVATG